MNIYLKPTGLHSRAMTRIAAALRRHLPPSMVEVDEVEDADLQVLYVIESGAIDYGLGLIREGRNYAVIQCCYETAGPSRSLDDWDLFWEESQSVWSYLNIPYRDLLHQPLGVDPVFVNAPPRPFNTRRRPHIITTGYVSGYGCEAIDEVWEAARLLGWECTHIGPRDVVGMDQPANWRNVFDITDDQMVRLYQSADYVSGLRYVEGFELPAAEGLYCGAVPLLFDLPDMRRWYGYNATYFDGELRGEGLVNALVDRLTGFDERICPVAFDRSRFDWAPLCDRFFSEIAVNMGLDK